MKKTINKFLISFFISVIPSYPIGSTMHSTFYFKPASFYLSIGPFVNLVRIMDFISRVMEECNATQ